MTSALSLRPFFIVGSPRSGTTLLRFMLSSHSRLYVPDETGFLPFLPYDPNQWLVVAEINDLLQRIGQLNRYWAGMIADVPAFCESLPEPRLPFVIDALYRQKSRAQRALRWGDKTPLYVRYIPQLLTFFPQAQFVHVLRDGRDTALSARSKWGATHRYMDIYYLLANWQRNVHDGAQAAQTLPPAQFYTLRYENLVADPEAEIGQVCDFLGESFEPAMLAQTELARQVGGGLDEHLEVQTAVHGQSVGRWRREMTGFEKRLADDLVGDTLRHWAYDLADMGQLTTAERLRKAALAAKFLLSNRIRSLLYRTGILTLNRNRR